jgi:ribosomal-protein-alanine N-acetyltransferase
MEEKNTIVFQEMEFAQLSTERLYIRIVSAEQHQKLFALLTDEELVKFFGFPDNRILQLEKDKIKGGLTTYNRSYIYFLLIPKTSHEVIGVIGFHNWMAMHQRTEVGYVIYHERYKNKGFMREAMPLILNYGFNTLKLNRIEAFIGIQNLASQRLVKRVGFQHEGTLREHFISTTIPEPSMVFGLLKKEWLTQHG